MNGLLIGRFQPFHLGHLEALKFALNKVDNLWIGLGSSDSPIEKTNPFSAEERKQMIESSLDDQALSKIKIFNIPDVNNHIKWIEKIYAIVPPFEIIFSNDDLTTHLFTKRGVKTSQIPFVQRDELSGTKIRDLMKTNQNWKSLLPSGTIKVLEKIKAIERLKHL